MKCIGRQEDRKRKSRRSGGGKWQRANVVEVEETHQQHIGRGSNPILSVGAGHTPTIEVHQQLRPCHHNLSSVVVQLGRNVASTIPLVFPTPAQPFHCWQGANMKV